MELKLFRQFMKEVQKSEGRPYWTEMALGVSHDDEMPLPIMVTNLLSFLPAGGPKKKKAAVQANVLRWIMTKGLFEATYGRKKLAELASEKLGRRVSEHEVFSQKAHQSDPALGRLYENYLKPLFEKEYEPNHIIVPSLTKGNKIYVDLPEINKEMEAHGLRPFHFGGTDGLIEYIEQGSWARPLMIQPHMGSEKGTGAEHVRHGIDLSDPHLNRLVERPGKFEYAYRGWKPDMEYNHYREKLKALAHQSGKEMVGVLSGQDPKFGEDLWGRSSATPEEQQALKRLVHNLYASQRLNYQSEFKSPFGDKGGTLTETPPLPEDEYNLWKMIVDRGLHIANSQRPDPSQIPDKPWLGKFSEEDLQSIMKNYFNDDKRTVRWKAINPVFKRMAKERKFSHDRSNMPQDQFYRLGAEALAREGVKVPPMHHVLGYFNYGKYIGDVEGNYFQVNPEELLSQGYTLLPGESLEDAKHKGWVELHSNKGKVRLEYDRDPESGEDIWLVKKPQQKGEAIKNLQPAHLLVPGRAYRHPVSGIAPTAGYGTMSTGRGLKIDLEAHPEIKRMALQRAEQWRNNLESYMEDRVGQMMLPESVLMAARMGFRRALLQSGWSTEELKGMLGGNPQQILVGDAEEAMTQLTVLDWRFWFGDPGKEFKRKPASEDIDSLGLEGGKENRQASNWKTVEGKDTSIMGLLTSIGGIPANDVKTKEEMVTRFFESIKKGEWPSPATFGGNENVYRAFLRNGVHWRADTAANIVAQRLMSFIRQKEKERNIKTKDDEGNETNLTANITDNEKRIQARINRAANVAASLGQRPTADEERERVNPESDPLAAGEQAARRESLINVFQKSRSAEVKTEDYRIAYRTAYVTAEQHMASFRRMVETTTDTPPEDENIPEIEVRRIRQTRNIFAPLSHITGMFKKRSPSPNANAGRVDGICDAVSNDLIQHFSQFDRTRPEDVEKWGRYLRFLYHAFFIESPVHNLAALAKDEANVDVGPAFAKVRQVLTSMNSQLHQMASQLGAESRRQEQQDVETERSLLQKQSERFPLPVGSQPGAFASFGKETERRKPKAVQPPVPVPQPSLQPAPQPGAAQEPPSRSRYERKSRFSRSRGMKSFGDWRNANIFKEMGVPVGPHAEFGVKAKDGGGFNYWGVPGKPGGVSITGEVPVKSKKGKNGRKK